MWSIHTLRPQAPDGVSLVAYLKEASAETNLLAIFITPFRIWTNLGLGFGLPTSKKNLSTE
jgi:hypothetical protein